MHTNHHNHLTGAEPLDTNAYSRVISVRRDNVQSWKDKGYEVIADDHQSCLMGILKVVVQDEPLQVEEVNLPESIISESTEV